MISQRDKPGQGVANTQQELDELKKEIEQVQAHLRELWARQRALRARSKLKRMPSHERRKKILPLIKSGKSLEQIAKEWGYAYQTVRKDAKSAIVDIAYNEIRPSENPSLLDRDRWDRVWQRAYEIE